MDVSINSDRPHHMITGAYADAAVTFATSLLDNANDLVAAVNTDLRLVGLNAAFRREFELVFGRTLELGQRLDNALAHVTGDRDKAIELCRRALAGETFRVTEELGDEQLLRKTYELAFSPVFDTHHQVFLAAIVMRDLTNQRLSERRFGALLEAAPDATLIIRSDGLIDLANAHAERMFGYGRHQLTGLPVEKLLPERFRKSHLAHRQQFARHPAARPMGQGRGDLWGLRADGTEFPIDISLNPLDIGGEQMVVGAVRDMTIRQRTEDRLREMSAELEQRVAERTAALEQANDEFRVTFERAPVGIAHLAIDGRWLRVNKTLCDIVGYPEEELLAGMAFQDITHPEDLDRELALVKKMLAGELSSFSLEKRYLRKNGAVAWVSINRTLLRDAHGTPKYFIAVVTDINARKQAEQTQIELEQHRTQLAAILDSLSEGVVIADLSGNVLNMNPEALAMHDFSDVSEIRMRLPDFARNFALRQLDGALLPLDDWPLARVLRGERFTDFELEVHDLARGTRRMISYSGTPVYDHDGNSILAVLVLRDISAQKHAEQALRESEAELKATFEQAAVGIVHVSIPDRRFLRVNNAFCRILGYAPEELLGRDAAKLSLPEDCSIGDENYARLLDGQISSFTMEKRARRKDDAVVWARVTVSPVRDQHGAILYGVAVVEDITEVKQLDLARQETENRLQLAVAIAHLGFWEWDVVANDIYFSPHWKKQLGYQDGELRNGTEEWILRLHPEDRQRVLDYIADFVARPNEMDFRLEYRLRHRDDSYRWMAARAIALGQAGERAAQLIGIQLDITEAKLAEQRVLEAAQHDPLTGLPSRALIFEYAGHILAAARRSHNRGAFLFIDLDRFKPVNDLYGHETGDQLLKEAAKRLVSCVRDEDLVGRLGGDEFIVVLPHLRGNRAETVAAHLLEAVSQPFHIGSLDLSISASIGISYFPQHGTDVDSLIHAADLAMYRTKQGGRANYHLYSSELDTQTGAAAAIEARLKHALQSGGLQLHYQPVIDMKNRHLIGVEALLRLVDENADEIGPDRFIPIAESAGLIGTLGQWVAAEACRQHEEWRRLGLPPLNIAINISPLQFRQRGFADTLEHAIRDSGVAPSRIQIEVTESTVMENVDDAIKILNNVKSMGVRVALDDFGTGYSSLSQLSQLPLDKLKVDQSFVRRIDNDRASRAITGAIIALGRTLDLEIVCEGIESEYALHYLQAQGGDQAQGFYISRPLPPAEFGRWYREHCLA